MSSNVDVGRLSLYAIAQNICKIQVGQTLNDKGIIQDCQKWSTSISRAWSGDNHTKTCNFLNSKIREIIAHIDSNQCLCERFIIILPDLRLALSRYLETCKDKWYLQDIENAIKPLQLLIEDRINICDRIKKDEEYKRLKK